MTEEVRVDVIIQAFLNRSRSLGGQGIRGCSWRAGRELRIARITADELKQKIDAGEELVIVDLRHSVDFEADPHTIPGAFRMDAKDLEEKDDRLPRDRDVILYCT